MPFDRKAYQRRWAEQNREVRRMYRRKSYRRERLRKVGVDPDRIVGWLHELGCSDPRRCRCKAYPVYRPTELRRVA